MREVFGKARLCALLPQPHKINAMPDRKTRETKAKIPRPPKPKAPRTAGGNKASPQLLAEASRGAQEGYRERTEAGHRAAGRTPPSERMPPPGGPTTPPRIVDDAIRNYLPPVTEDEKLLQSGSSRDDFTRTDPWRVMRIMGEFIEGFDNLA